MMLRASSQHFGFEADVRAIGKTGFDSGVPQGAVLVEFSEAIMGRDAARLDRAREALSAAFGPTGPAAVSDTSAVAANFQMMDRIANGCGIALDSLYERPTRRYRKELGMESFRSAENSPDAAP